MGPLGEPIIAAASVHWFSGWSLTGNFTTLDLIALTTNALGGALLARRPDHYRNFTAIGILLMALLGGLSGGIIREVLLNHVPAALLNPAYVAFALAAGVVGYLISYTNAMLFREGLFQLVASFALPWYAIIGAQQAVSQGIPALGALLIAVTSATAGRYLIDISCGVPPKQFVRGEWFVAAAAVTGIAWIIADSLGAGTWLAAGIGFAFGFTLRLTALYRGWEEPLAGRPAGVHHHGDGRPLFGRKLAGKSPEELRDLGLQVDADDSVDTRGPRTQPT
jgi:uncharacterized membrane protein YeiH